VTSEVKVKILLILWHAWHMRNDVVHAKGTTTIMGSTNFLLNYEEALNSVSRPLVAQNDDKGKERVNEGAVSKKPTMYVPHHQERKQVA
jgi:hypothetical protein